jgi:arylsulfatase A-like enzyme
MPKQPNILLIFTDQLRADALGAAPNPVIRTPNLDRLAREGVLFTSAFSPSPVCVSARCSLIYGQYPHRTGCADNADAMPVDRPSFIQRLTDAGYRTHGVGKMHFTPDSQALRGWQSRERQEELLNRVEDDDYLQFLHAAGFGHVTDPMGARGEMYYVPQPAPMPAELHPTQWVGDRSVAFIEQTQGDQPFLLWSSFVDPHPPFTPPAPWHKLYRAPLMPLPKLPHQFEALQIHINRVQNRYKFRDNGTDYNLLRCIKAYYYATVSFIDYQVGRILAALERRGLLDDTLILFTSDHGEFLGDYGCFGKRAMLDAAAHIPLLVRHPQSFVPGTRCDQPVSLVDVMPTFLAAAYLEADETALSGIDLAQIAQQPAGNRTVYSQYQHADEGVYMAVNRRFKYVYSAPDRKELLFDRLTDPEETRNQAGLTFRRAELEAMRAGVFAFYRQEGFAEPLSGDSWRLYPQPEEPQDPDAGLLIQDHGWAIPQQVIPGYSDDL